MTPMNYQLPEHGITEQEMNSVNGAHNDGRVNLLHRLVYFITGAANIPN
jgi:hypothetical protein